MRLVSGRGGLVGALGAATVSILGSRMSFIAVPWLVFVTTGSPAKMGLIAALEMAPYVLATSLGAPLIDRLSPRRMTILADVSSAAVLVALALTYTGGLVTIGILVAVVGALRGLADNARKLLIPPMAEAAGVPMVRVVALYDSFSRLAMMVGAAVAGMLIAGFGAPAAVLINAASFVVAAAVVAAVVRPAAAPVDANSGREPYLTALRGGFRYLREDRLLFGIAGMLVGINLFNQASGVVFIPLWAADVLGSPAAIGFVLGTGALGAVIGSIAFTALATRVPRYATFTLGFLLGGAPRFLILALSQDLATVLVVTFLAGVASAAINPIIGTVMFERTPKPLQARVFGLVTAASWAGIPLGGLLGGWAVEASGLYPALLVTGLLYLAVALTPVLGHRRWRELSASPVDPPEPSAQLGSRHDTGGGR